MHTEIGVVLPCFSLFQTKVSSSSTTWTPTRALFFLVSVFSFLSAIIDQVPFVLKSQVFVYPDEFSGPGSCGDNGEQVSLSYL